MGHQAEKVTVWMGVRIESVLRTRTLFCFTTFLIGSACWPNANLIPFHCIYDCHLNRNNFWMINFKLHTLFFHPRSRLVQTLCLLAIKDTINCISHNQSTENGSQLNSNASMEDIFQLSFFIISGDSKNSTSRIGEFTSKWNWYMKWNSYKKSKN